jgi:hypothetical protein
MCYLQSASRRCYLGGFNIRYRQAPGSRQADDTSLTVLNLRRHGMEGGSSTERIEGVYPSEKIFAPLKRSAHAKRGMEAPGGFEPPHRSFADCSLSHLGTAPWRALYSGTEASG